MRRAIASFIAACLLLGLAIPASWSQEKNPGARITLVGNIARVEPTDLEVGGKKVGAVLFRLVKDTPVVGKVSASHFAWLRPETDVKPVHDQALKRQKTYLEQKKKAIADEKDEVEASKLANEYAFEILNPPPFVLVEGGTVGVVERKWKFGDKKYSLYQVVIAGKARVLDAEQRQKWQKTGGVVVEGVAVQGEFAVGEETYRLGIENGKLPIVLTGEAAKEKAKATGTIRVTGELRAEKDRLLLKVESLEGVKKTD